MSDPASDLERLISRHLDDECTSRERRELNVRVQRDPHAAALFEQHAALDREVKYALRRALGRTPISRRLPTVWERSARLFAVAAAACLVVMLWLTPARRSAPLGEQASAQPGSWFASLPTAGDSLIDQSQLPSQPQIRHGESHTDWILIPSDTPGEFLVIQVDRRPTRAADVQKDF